MKLRRVVRWSLVVVALIAAFFVWQIGPRNIVGMLLYDQRREGTFKVGDVAPDVALHRINGPGVVRLSEWIREKPLVLIFGSFT